MRTVTRRARTAGILLAATLLAACGSDAEPDSDAMDDMDHGESMDSSMVMNDPDATPADEVDGDVTQGDFTVLDTAPPGSDGVTGTAWLAQNDSGTTLTVRLSGLEPETEYVGHLHEQVCTEDDGGDHFQFEDGGDTMPPNEVHIGFTSDAEGNGEATVTNEQRVDDRAPSVVIHPAETSDNRLACAEFA